MEVTPTNDKNALIACHFFVNRHVDGLSDGHLDRCHSSEWSSTLQIFNNTSDSKHALAVLKFYTFAAKEALRPTLTTERNIFNARGDNRWSWSCACVRGLETVFHSSASIRVSQQLVCSNFQISSFWLIDRSSLATLRLFWFFLISMMLRVTVLLLVCMAVVFAMPYVVPLQGAQGGFRTLVIVEDMVRRAAICVP